MDMTAHAIEAAKSGVPPPPPPPLLPTCKATARPPCLGLPGGVRRFIFSSSNHVFGRYWREGSTLSRSGRPITVDPPPAVGTQFR